LAGALDAATDRVVWVKGERKEQPLFIDLLKKLLVTYADKKVIHLVLDNTSSKQQRRGFGWPSSAEVPAALPAAYCPDDNRIERKIWREMHAT